MARKNEREFVGGDMTDEEFAALNGDVVSDTVETVVEEVSQSTQDAISPDGVPDVAPAQETPPAGEPEPKMVDVRALQEARSLIRQRDEELAKTKAEQVRLDERLKILNEAIAAQNKPQEQAPAVPSKDEDPLGYYEHQIQSLEQRLAKFDETEQQRQKASQADQQHNALITRASSYLDQAVASNPQVGEALEFAFEGLRNEIRGEIARRGVPMEQQAAAAEQMWRSSMATMAQRLPADPQGAAEFVFRNARYYGWGYQPPQQVQEQAAAQQAPHQQAPQVQQPTIQQRQEQQQRHMSLSGVSGAEPPKALDAKAIANMPEKEWREFVKTAAGKKAMEEHFGGL